MYIHIYTHIMHYLFMSRLASVQSLPIHDTDSDIGTAR